MNIEFTFNYNQNVINLSSDRLKNNMFIAIKEECSKLGIVVHDRNIILYDKDNHVKINTYEDLINLRTRKCKIIIVPIILN